MNYEALTTKPSIGHVRQSFSASEIDEIREYIENKFENEQVLLLEKPVTLEIKSNLLDGLSSLRAKSGQLPAHERSGA